MTRVTEANNGTDTRPLTLFCLPYAGGSAAVFREWSARLPETITLVPLNLPGRGVRHHRAPLHDWPALLDVLVADMLPRLNQPFALFGHSMGALLAVELAHAIRARHGMTPQWLGVSACTAPSRRPRETHWLTCTEAVFLDEVRRLNGMPEELLDNREFMALVSPYLRADFHLCGTYPYRPGRVPLDCPMLLLAGALDSLRGKPGDAGMEKTDAAVRNAEAWSRESAGPFALHSIDAGHFFINTHRDQVIDRVMSSIREHVGVFAA
jgi:surfactin synthase thioesterase subunit